MLILTQLPVGGQGPWSSFCKKCFVFYSDYTILYYSLLKVEIVSTCIGFKIACAIRSQASGK